MYTLVIAISLNFSWSLAAVVVNMTELSLSCYKKQVPIKHAPKLVSF